MLAHVEQAEARQVVVDEELFLFKLLLHLADLHRSHAAAIGSQFAVGVLLETYDQLFRGGGGEGGKELAFKDGEVALEVFDILDGRNLLR